MKPQLVMLPGLLNDDDLWRDQIAGLSDLVACHVGDVTRGRTLTELAEGILAEAAASFSLAGFSFGGYVALEILRLAPQRIERLALLGTSMYGDTPERAAARRALGRAARASGTFTGMNSRMLEAYVDRKHLSDDDLIGRILAMTRRLGRDVFIRQNAVERTDNVATLRQFRRPVLILCGENDRIVPPAIHHEMAKTAPSACLVVVPDSGHMVPMEQPHPVTNAMRDWLLRN